MYNPGPTRDNGPRTTVDGLEDGLPVPLTHRLRPGHWLALDTVLAVVLGITSIAFTGRDLHAPHPRGQAFTIVFYLAIGAACLPLPARRRYPRAVLAVVLVGEAVLIGLGIRGTAHLAAGFAMYSLATTLSSRQSSPVVAAAVAILLVAGAPAWDGQTLETIVFASGSILVGWLAGENVWARREHALALAQRAAEREREQARGTAIEERARIARELHDVVAHAMSVIAVRAGAARLVRDQEPAQAAEALDIIETISRRSLVELRRIVGALRQADEHGTADLGPAPGLDDLPALVSQVAAAGVEVDVRIEGESRQLPPMEDLSAYRIAQEALTNVVRHSGAPSATLWVRYRPGALEIECLDAGGPGPRRPSVELANGGHGLVGMRERVALFGGELSAGACGRGFRVLARLPVAEEAR
jgi:signal transduction histidine kinase